MNVGGGSQNATHFRAMTVPPTGRLVQHVQVLHLPPDEREDLCHRGELRANQRVHLSVEQRILEALPKRRFVCRLLRLRMQ